MIRSLTWSEMDDAVHEIGLIVTRYRTGTVAPGSCRLKLWGCVEELLNLADIDDPADADQAMVEKLTPLIDAANYIRLTIKQGPITGHPLLTKALECLQLYHERPVFAVA